MLWHEGHVAISVWSKWVTLNMELNPGRRLEVQLKGDHCKGLTLQVDESDRFGKKAWRIKSDCKNPELPFEVRFARKDDDLPQFGTYRVRLSQRGRGLFEAQLPPLHILPWPMTRNATMYEDPAELKTQILERQASALMHGERLGFPDDVLLAMDRIGLD